MPVSRAEIESMIPHSGRMCLLDRVLSWDAITIRCISRNHRDADNPLRAGAAFLPALCGIEYAAQAMAVHGRLSSAVEQRPRAGYLASVSDLVCNAERLDDIAAELVVEAEKIAGDAERVLYRFALSAEGRLLLHGMAAVVLDAGK
jgi:predicted hotdog family 3-hydroxylacyl-ACP dehydratase